jgi:hypothetical protein
MTQLTKAIQDIDTNFKGKVMSSVTLIGDIMVVFKFDDNSFIQFIIKEGSIFGNLNTNQEKSK